MRMGWNEFLVAFKTTALPKRGTAA